jgi:hypothetical protein
MQTFQSVFGGFVLLSGSNIYFKQVKIIPDTTNQQYGSGTTMHTATDSTADTGIQTFRKTHFLDLQIEQKSSEVNSASIFK